MPGPVFCQEPGSRRQDTLPPKSRFESYPADEVLDQTMSVTALPVLLLTVPAKVGLPPQVGVRGQRCGNIPANRESAASLRGLAVLRRLKNNLLRLAKI
jgi:hypothetical protein